MSKYDCVCGLIKEHFGDIVEKVCVCLVKQQGAKTLNRIFRDTKLPLSKVRQSLCVLIQHQMVRFEVRKGGVIEYSMDTEEVFTILRYHRYLQCIKTLFGELGELVGRKLLYHGQSTMTCIIKMVADTSKQRPRPEMYAEAKETFVKMVNEHFLCRVLQSPLGEPKPVIDSLEFQNDLYRLPTIELNLIDNDDEANKDNVYWRINNGKIDQYFRNQMIVNAIERSIDGTAAKIVDKILTLAANDQPWVTVSRLISRQDIGRLLKDSPEIVDLNLNRYLILLLDDSTKILSKMADQQGGMYAVNWKECVRELTWATVESIIHERFGSDCLRIFRVIRLRKFIEQKQIGELAMVPAKEAKSLTYRLFVEHIVSAKEYSRTADHAPSRTVYLFHIDLPQLVTNMLEWCYRAVANLSIRRTVEYKGNKKIIEKEAVVKNILDSLNQPDVDEEQVKVAEDMISSSEKDQLIKLKKFFKQTELGELCVGETIFVFEMYLRYFKS